MYISPYKDFNYPEIKWMRDLSWTFDKNLKLHEIYYHITTSDGGYPMKYLKIFRIKIIFAITNTLIQSANKTITP